MMRREAKAWVRGWWADQMRNPTIPDLSGMPPEEDRLIAEVWAEESARLANVIHPADRRS